ncbi:Uncharacterised protein (plasmid) [Tsukamurella tyrosinosolvens]|uniref:HicA toxin of toxin-antitoxin n=1 Tax=Tsukamurella tyrosinosolvens TaxID=57704 RepID=A0A1H4U8R6_TSUTY|nr:hypothetical protein [Tsukamurella tyrosinosolvens]KXO92995.1 hypothetical protein AXK58_14085 [Tsukamurella tyrosinosolvens]SEC65087.1 hypothetical protein SAMN04489793_2816 [Tsukamurella tyrosinosolvens]VEH94061.1 Uncharacterised protein [Tsukamurella tyrosinosolvens]
MGGSDYKKRLKNLIAAAEKENWTVSKTGGGHWKFVPADKTKDIVHAPATSSDRRGVANVEADLKRSGLEL